jgi:hypothetical protein
MVLMVPVEQPVGSTDNPACRIDAIAQSHAMLDMLLPTSHAEADELSRYRVEPDAIAADPRGRGLTAAQGGTQ